jgi:hypothetical protein
MGKKNLCNMSHCRGAVSGLETVYGQYPSCQLRLGRCSEITNSGIGHNYAKNETFVIWGQNQKRVFLLIYFFKLKSTRINFFVNDLSNFGNEENCISRSFHCIESCLVYDRLIFRLDHILSIINFSSRCYGYLIGSEITK